VAADPLMLSKSQLAITAAWDATEMAVTSPITAIFFMFSPFGLSF
jgi:hypothetical protein